ncbi:uncharacterized protein C8A04DRAFT_27889 [Dichotomopilus funicola]|uniref:MARVEL domain-containing protein n=1 Tax=Dichotomopilus funicola TaxID=1934379 RepID=A0AAN6V450_9PEZI|nr:hypothetical protein C8A04DRAFT_27889 [Dichotomopilus funicola]
MRTVAKNPLSLRPEGFYSYAFLALRAAEVVCLAIITGLMGTLLSATTRGRQPAQPMIIILTVYPGLALAWALLSWTGYSRRYFMYDVTWSIDFVLLIPFVALTVVLGLPMADFSCSAVRENGKFEISAPPSLASGRMAFATDGRSACSRLFAVWTLLIVVCVLFTLSALSIVFLQLGQKQLQRAILAGKNDPMAYSQEGVNTRGFTPTPPAQTGYGGYADDRLNLNRAVPVPPVRSGSRAGAGNYIYEESLGQPPAARVPRMHPDEAYGYGGGALETQPMNPSDTDTARDRQKVSPIGRDEIRQRPAGRQLVGLGNVTMSSSRGQPRSNNGPGSVAAGRKDPIPRSASFGKVPEAKETVAENGSTPKTSEMETNKPHRGVETGIRRGHNGVDEDAPGDENLGDSGAPQKHTSGTPLDPHGSLVPKPLDLGKRGRSARKGDSDSAASGWWAALDSVIYKPQAEYDPSNVL